MIARIESGATSPSLKTLERLLRHAGCRLQISWNREPSHMLSDVARILKLSPEERLVELRNAARLFASARRISGGRIRS